MSDTRILPPVPGNQFWLDTLVLMAKKTVGVGDMINLLVADGACHGYMEALKMAIFCDDTAAFDLRNSYCYYGVPDAKDPNHRINLADLKSLAIKLNLSLPDQKNPADEKSVELPVSDDSNEYALGETDVVNYHSDLMKLIGNVGLRGIMPIVPKSDEIEVSCPDLMSRSVLPVSPPIAAEDLIEQIELARAIRASFIENLLQKKLDPVKKAAEIAGFDKEYPYVLSLIDIGIHFIIIALFQAPVFYGKWLTGLKSPLSQLDTFFLNQLLAPAKLDEMARGQSIIVEQTRFKGTYSHQQLTTYFATLEVQIKTALESKEMSFAGGRANFPLLLTLHARGNHSLVIGYDIKTSQWIVGDMELPTYQVGTLKIAKHLLRRFCFLQNITLSYPGFEFHLLYNKKAETAKDKFILVAANFDEEKAPESCSARFKEAYEQHLPAFTQDIAQANLFFRTRVFILAAFKEPLEKMTNAWLEDKEFKAIHELNLQNMAIIDRFCPLSMQHTTNADDVEFWMKNKDRIANLKPHEFADFYENDGKPIRQQILSAENLSLLADVFLQLPNKRFWLWLAANHSSTILKLIRDESYLFQFHYDLNDALYAGLIVDIVSCIEEKLLQTWSFFGKKFESVRYVVEELHIDLSNVSRYMLNDFIKQGHLLAVQYICETFKVDINESGFRNDPKRLRAPISVAFGQLDFKKMDKQAFDIFNYLKDRGGNLFVDYHLYLSARSGDMKKLQYICETLKSFDRSWVDVNFRNAVYIAIDEGNFPEANYLLSQGFNIDGVVRAPADCKKHFVPAFINFVARLNSNAVKFFLDNNANIFVYDSNGCTAMQLLEMDGVRPPGYFDKQYHEIMWKYEEGYRQRQAAILLCLKQKMAEIAAKKYRLTEAHHFFSLANASAPQHDSKQVPHSVLPAQDLLAPLVEPRFVRFHQQRK